MTGAFLSQNGCNTESTTSDTDSTTGLSSSDESGEGEDETRSASDESQGSNETSTSTSLDDETNVSSESSETGETGETGGTASTNEENSEQDSESVSDSDPDESSESSTSSNTTDSSESSSSDASTDSTTDSDADDDEDPGCAEIRCSSGDPLSCGANERCSPFRCDKSFCCSDSTHCVERLGDQKVGEECVRDSDKGNDDCAPALFCLPEQGTSAGSGPGQCMQLCDPFSAKADQCADFGVPNAHCFAFNSGSFPVCVPTCDPLAPSCEKGKGCFFAIDNFFCTDPTPSVVGDGGPGSQCNTEQGCKAGHACTPADLLADCETDANGVINGCCSVYCNIEAPKCPTPLECVKLPVKGSGVENVGICGNPK